MDYKLDPPDEMNDEDTDPMESDEEPDETPYEIAQERRLRIFESHQDDDPREEFYRLDDGNIGD